MKTYEIRGYFGLWGMMSTLEIEAYSYKDAVHNLKTKIIKKNGFRVGDKVYFDKYYCKVVGYRVFEVKKPYMEFKNEITYNS